MAELKLGSLFDGSGGFPLAGALNGIKPVWASEIEPFPIRVTKARFPNMKHLGDVTKINGAEIEPVDIITFGSPCQDLSVAGKQLGIHDGQRSNLFFEAIRIIKEMREHDRATGRADDDLRPRFAVWENVPGAFSSNKGKDFQAVLQAFCDIEGAGITVPMPPKGKWNPAGCIVGDGFSVAWRIYDAQYWGVPQRRKRIYLIADFGSERAGEILFECEGVCGNPAKGRETGEGTSADAEGSAGRSGEPICLNFQGNKGGCSTTQDGTAYSLNAMHGHDVHVIADKVGSAGRGRALGVDCYNQVLTGEKSVPIRSAASDADHVGAVVYPCGAVRNTYNESGIGTCGALPEQKVCFPINTMVATRVGKDDMRTCFGVGQSGDPQFTISAAHEHAVCYSIEGHVIDRQTSQNGRGWAEGYAHTLNATDRHAVCYGIDQQGGKGGANYQTDISPTLLSDSHGTPHAVCVLNDQGGSMMDVSDRDGTLRAQEHGHQPIVCMQNTGRGWWNQGEIAETLRTPCGGDSTKANLVVYNSSGNGVAETLDASYYKGTGARNGAERKVIAVSVSAGDKPPRKYIVRRLTPLECCRLQGFPDYWTDGVDGSDSAKYKMWGNGIALPCAVDVIGRIANELRRGRK